MTDLNDAQRAAAYAEGSVAVTAGAGTGKTHMLAARYLFHVEKQEMSPLSVVAVTFTDKAADELRSRIREKLAASGVGSDALAEVDAAQISTIHSLAARICRDFYDVAGIPADFSVMDDLQSPIWLASKFAESAAAVDPELIGELGYSWLQRCLPQLLRDTYTAQQALAATPDMWRAAIEDLHTEAVRTLKGSPEWRAAFDVVGQFSGPDANQLEIARRCIVCLIEAVAAGESIAEAAVAVDKCRPDLGPKSEWPAGAADSLRPVLKALKAKVRELLPGLSLCFGRDDEELYRRCELLRTAFRQANAYLADAKLRENLLDFADLENYALRILEDPGGEARAHYAARWKAFLIDEFQDTSPVQEKLLEVLTAGAVQTIVGDEKQAIYGFRGADIDVFGRVRGRIKRQGGEEKTLGITYRSHGPLVDATNRLFEPVLGSLHQPLEADRPADVSTGGPYISGFFVEKNAGNGGDVVEANRIAEEIRSLVGKTEIFDKKLMAPRPLAYGDIAVLARKWAPLDTILDVLAAAGVPAVNAGGGNLLETREAIDAAALLAFLAEPADDIPLVTLLRSPMFGISDRVLFEISLQKARPACWWDAIADRPETAAARDTLQTLLSLATRSGAAEVVRAADSMTAYSAIIANLPHGNRRVADWRGMIEMLDGMDRRGHGVHDASRQIALLRATGTEVPRPPLEPGNAVTLMTVHKSKGLEWPVVFVAALDKQGRANSDTLKIDRELGVAFAFEDDAGEDREPAICTLIKQRRKEREAAEAKRLLYVAVTRARDRVYLTASSETGGDVEILRPGLGAANVPCTVIPYDRSKAVISAPAETALPDLPDAVQAERIPPVSRSVPATALRTYAACPHQFRLRYVDGHPGAGEGAATATDVGSLAHIALEYDISEAAGLLVHAPEAEPAGIAEALRIANAFREAPAFAEFKNGAREREKKFVLDLGRVRVRGSADLVGDDFVLDYKTDTKIDPDHHKLQLWAYARALAKPRALLAYVRHGEVHEFDPADLADAGDAAERIAGGIADARYEPTPSAEVCTRCSYESICGFRAA